MDFLTVRSKKGFTGVAKTGIALLGIILVATFFIQFVFPTIATTYEVINATQDISNNLTSVGQQLNFTINNSNLGDNNNIIELNITFDHTVFEYVTGSNISANTSARFNDTFATVGNLSWYNTTVDGWVYSGVNESVAFNFTVLNRTHRSWDINFTVRYDNQTLAAEVRTLTISVNDNIAPVINESIPLAGVTTFTGAYTNNLTDTIFQVNLTDENPGGGAASENVTLFIRRFTSAGGGAIKQVNLPCIFGSVAHPTWLCNASVDLSAGPLGAGNGDTLGFWFNTTDLNANAGTNGTENANFTLVVDTTQPSFEGVPLINNSDDLLSTAQINLSILVNDTHINNSGIVASGDSGATNVTLDLTSDNGANAFDAFNVSLNGSVLGCGTAGICTVTIYATDNAGNTNSTSFTLIIDDVIPNVTAPFTNTTLTDESNTSALFTVSSVFLLNVTAVDNFNMTNVTFNNVNEFGGTNVSNGNWSVEASASDFGCTDVHGTLNNCRIHINATDNATNSNSSVFLDITIDDIRPNVTLSTPGSGNSTTSATVSFNVTVLEPNPGSGVVEITPEGQSSANYSLVNNSGSWGFTNTSMPDGVYTVRFIVNDSLGNTNGSVEYTFAVDTTVPAVSAGFSNDTIVSGTQIILLNVTVTDTNRDDTSVNVTAGGHNSSMTFTVNDIFQSNSTFTAESVGCTINVHANCTLSFSVADAAGNVNDSHNIAITVDDIAPNVTVTSPTNVTLGNSMAFTISVNEDNPENETPNVVQITHLSAGQTGINYTITNSSGNWSYENASMPDGVYNAQFFVYDAANNLNNSVNVNFTVDTVDPVVNTTLPASGGFVSDASAVVFEVKLVELNVNQSDENVTVNYRRQSTTPWHSNTTECFPDPDDGPNPPHWVCNLTIDVQGIAGINPGDVMEYAFNTTTTQTQLQTASNGTLASPLSATVDNTNPKVETPLTNASGFDLQTTFTFNISVTVEDTGGAGIDAVYVSGDTGATNVSMIANDNNAYNVSTTGSSLGCATIGVCTLTFYANDTAGNLNATTTTNVFMDDIPPNVTDPYTNWTIFTGSSPIITGTTVFRINATVLENFNISNVTFGNVTALEGTNATNGNWSSDATADDYGCDDDSGVANNCRIYIIATDNATNSNSSVFLDITVDDLRPNVTLSTPGSGNSTTSATVSFNVTVLEPNAGVGNVEITPSGQDGANYSLTNNTGNWGFTNGSMPDGVYTFRFFLNDTLNNTNNSVTGDFAVDTTAPVVNNVSTNVTDDQLSTTTFNLTVNVTDTNRVDGNVNASGDSGATNVTLTLTHDNKFNAETTGSALGCGTAGICTITVYAVDAGGNSASASTTVSIDDVAPNVTDPYTNTTLLDESNSTKLYTSTEVFQINVTAVDNANMSNVTFGNVTALEGTNATNGNWSNSDTPANYGCNEVHGVVNNCLLTITATDNATNTNSSATLYITVDDIVPNVTVTSPTNVTNSTSRVVNFNISVLEPNPASAVLELTHLSDGLAGINYTMTNMSGVWGLTNTSLPDGVYRARYVVNDSLGNTNESVEMIFTISIDTAVPNVTITSPTNSTITTTRVVNFNATVLEDNAEAGILQVTHLSAGQDAINYTLINASGVWGYTNASMPDGTYLAEFLLNDTLGNVNFSQTVTFTMAADETAPNGSILTVETNVTASGGFYVEDNITVNFNVFDDSPVTVQVMFQNSSGNFSITDNTTNATIIFNTTALADGNYTLVLNATDSVGNANHSIDTVVIVVDNTKPTLTQWRYDFTSRNLTLIFDDLVNSNDLVISSWNITSQNDSASLADQLGGNNEGLTGATIDLQNSTEINVTLTLAQDNALRGSPTYDGIWKLYSEDNAINNILGLTLSAISDKGYGNLTDFYVLKPSASSSFSIGITSFSLPLSILDDDEANVTLAGNRTITKVLESIEGNYQSIYAQNDVNSNWTSFVVGRPTNDFTEFLLDNSTYWINMTAQDRLEIGSKTVSGE